jgi:hypothetical protein
MRAAATTTYVPVDHYTYVPGNLQIAADHVSGCVRLCLDDIYEAFIPRAEAIEMIVKLVGAVNRLDRRTP